MGCGVSKNKSAMHPAVKFSTGPPLQTNGNNAMMHNASHHTANSQHHQQHHQHQNQQQQQYQHQRQQQQKPSRAALERHSLMRYVELEKEINSLEARNVVQHLQMKWDELKGLEQDIQRLSAIFQSCKEQALKEKQDVDEMNKPSVRQYFADQASFEAKLSKEQEEYVTALNKQEVAMKELQDAMQLKEKAKVNVKELHLEAERMQQLYKEQDSILSQIFDGKYGSDLEYQLERDHDLSCDKQQRISVAKARWQAAKLLVHHAWSQLAYAAERWDYVTRIPVDDPSLTKETVSRNSQSRYNIATEVRNYLIAASTNLRNSQNYLKGIDFPYCKIEEVNTLERATNNIFTDVGTQQRHQHAMQVYQSLHKRSGALLQWFDAVIDKTIEGDLLSATEELFEKKRLLRIERVRLIKEKLVEFLGAQAAEQAGLDEDANLTDARRLQEQLSAVNEQELKKQLENVKVVQAEQPKQVEQPESSEPEGSVQVPQPQPPHAPSISDVDERVEAMPLKDLAPPPSQDKLFGDIDSIKKQYEIDMEEFHRAQEVNRARVEQGLQEKLAARKSRKARKLTQQQETDRLLIDSGSA